MQVILKYKPFLIPALVAFLISSFYIVVIPGEVKSDAAAFDELANSILIGQYSLNGAPSMEREPGYPLFRSAIKLFTGNLKIILWIQALLYFMTVFWVGLVTQKIDPRIGSWGAWGAALSYGLAFYPSTHISETFVAFLLSLTGLALIDAINNSSFKNWFWLSIVSGALLLTRYTYVLVPIFSFIILAIISFKNNIQPKKIIKNFSVSVLIVMALVSPWLVRNYIIFKEINVAGRSGGILYARAWRTDKSWRSLADSYLSVFWGRGLLFTIYPKNQSIWLEQWGDWWRDKEKVKLWGNSQAEIDKNRKKAAFEIIFKDFNNFAKFVVWTGVDEFRLLELPNPIIQALGSPVEGTYGPLAKEDRLSFIQITLLVIAHIIQLFWFIAIIISTYLGFKKYGYKFIPGIFLICVLLPHSIADNIARYGAPLQPWLLSGIFMTIILPIYKTIHEKHIIKYNNSGL